MRRSSVLSVLAADTTNTAAGGSLNKNLMLVPRTRELVSCPIEGSAG